MENREQSQTSFEEFARGVMDLDQRGKGIEAMIACTAAYQGERYKGDKLADLAFYIMDRNIKECISGIVDDEKKRKTDPTAETKDMQSLNGYSVYMIIGLHAALEFQVANRILSLSSMLPFVLNMTAKRSEEYAARKLEEIEGISRDTWRHSGPYAPNPDLPKSPNAQRAANKYLLAYEAVSSAIFFREMIEEMGAPKQNDKENASLLGNDRKYLKGITTRLAKDITVRIAPELVIANFSRFSELNTENPTEGAKPMSKTTYNENDHALRKSVIERLKAFMERTEKLKREGRKGDS